MIYDNKLHSGFKNDHFAYVPSSIGWGAYDFHAWLLEHPKLLQYNNSINAIIATDKESLGWNQVYRAIGIMERAHGKDARKNNQQPYLVHQFEIISEYLIKYEAKDISLLDIVVLLLHDVIEDHPEYWKEILEQFGVKIFRDVLILSTGGIPFYYREEMLEYLNSSELFGSGFRNSKMGDPLYDIFHILDPRPPLRKLNVASRYVDVGMHSEKLLLERAIQYFARVLLGINPDEQTMESNKEYTALCHYIYMNPIDIRRKLQDMLNNMKDMEEMEKSKPGYIAKRHIKAYILLMKMKTYAMQDDIAELLGAFQSAGHPLHQAIIEERMQAISEKWKGTT